MIGYDLDGVIAVEKRWWNILYRTVPKVAVFLRDLYRARFVPSGKFVIVTNRPECDREATFRWLEKNDIRPMAVYFSKVSDPFGYEFKEKCIRELKITKFFESSEDTVKILSSHLPNVEVVHVP